MNKPWNQAGVMVAILLGMCMPVGAEPVQLPYQMSDETGNMWVVYYQGNLQMQGNQPVFSQAGSIQINGRQPQQQGQQGNWDETNRELTLNLRPAGNYKHERRIKFMENGLVRVLDFIENTTDEEQTYTIQFNTITNYGVTNTELIRDPKGKGELGWVANVVVGRAAISVFAGKGSKLQPDIRYQQQNNQVIAVFKVKISANQKAGFVSWHGTFDTPEEATAWSNKTNENKLVSDLSKELRKIIVNISITSAGMVGDQELLLGDKQDVLELKSGDLIRGTVLSEGYDLKTDFGEIRLPAEKVIGLFNVGTFQLRQLLVTKEGEVFGGELKQQAIPVLLSSGQKTHVPLRQISRLGYRNDQGEIPEWKFETPMVFLRSGERCVVKMPIEPIEFVTRYGTVIFKPEQVACVDMKTAQGVHTIYLADGSRLSGLIANPIWNLKLSALGDSVAISFPTAALARVQLRILPEDIGRGQPTLQMQDGDMVVTRLRDGLKFKTAFDTLDLDASQIRSLVRGLEGSGELQITMFDQSIFRGALQTPVLSCRLFGGSEIRVPVAAIVDYDNPQPLPSQIMTDQVKTLVEKLNAEDWKDREAAEASLMSMGPTILSVLIEMQANQPIEVQKRLEGLIARLSKNMTPVPSRLSPPPSME